MKEIQEFIIRSVGIIMDFSDARVSRLNADSCFDDLGMDSLDRTELVLDIEEEYGVDVSDEWFEENTTVGDIAKKISEAAD